ncbi:Alpha-adducin [Amphibalanus amphitrite]|uniref:Alpha-adducin n=1 Tax=Amphibalanus amphitrite TaxID=1232801 RepID=A0A6A4VQD3_AMPAM|nr:Alpha-adducin [Amphibalanus amphitrite]
MLRSLARLVRAAPPLPAETVLRRTPTVARLARPFGSLPGLRPIAINDLGADCPYSAEEQAVRCKLASLYRLVDARGWSMGIYNHITARITASDEHFLVNPFGLLYDEVTASNLVRLDLAGTVLDPGSSAAGVNLAGYVSTMQCGLLPITQEALVVHGFAGVSYHDYQGILINSAEKKDIQENLGPKNKVLTPSQLVFPSVQVLIPSVQVLVPPVQVLIPSQWLIPSVQVLTPSQWLIPFRPSVQALIPSQWLIPSVQVLTPSQWLIPFRPSVQVLVLRNHGVVVCGETVEEAYLLLDFFMIACQSQVAMMAAGVDGLAQISSVAFENMLKVGAPPAER